MNKYFKKIHILLIGFVLVVGLIGCEDTPDDPVCTNDQTLVDGVCVDPEPELDETAPIFSGVGEVAYTIGDPDPNYVAGVSVSDETDGQISDSIVVDSSLVDLTVEGTYVVTLTVSDAAGNETTATYNVVVTEAENPNADLAALDIATLSLPDGDSIVNNKITLPAFGNNGTYFYWSTSHSNIILANGYVINPHVGSDPVDVTLTCRAINGSYVELVDFVITVQPNPEVTVTSVVQLPFEGTSDEYVVVDDPSVDIFYVDNGAVPYVDIETFIDLLDGAIESDIVEFTVIGTDQLEIKYEVEWEDFDGTFYTEYYTALVDFTENTFTVNNFDFFGSYVASTESDYGDGLNYVDAIYVEGEEVVIPLGDYNFDLLIYNDGTKDNFLMPFHVANLLFAGGVYYDIYYNGDKLWGIDTFGISGGDAEDELLQQTVRTSSLNAEDAPADIKLATYNFLALAFNYFYGLKEDRGVEDYYDILSLRLEYMMDGNDYELYNKMFDIAYGLDDLHTSHVFVGYYVDDPTYGIGVSLSDLGSRTKGFYEGMWAVQDLLDEKYGTHAEDDLPTYRLIDDGKTAVIYLYGFTIDSPDEFKVIMDGLPATVENVVVDLGYNTGGNIGAVFRIFGYITEEQFLYHSQNPADNSAATYIIESDYDAYDQYNWYMISSGVSFSAANMMISMAQELDIATVMGRPSSGGASSIGVIISPDGTCLLISTNNVLSTRVGNEVDGYEYLSVEDGVDVDYTMIDVTSDSEIIAIIEEHQAETTE
jgi:hypothetical protein